MATAQRECNEELRTQLNRSLLRLNSIYIPQPFFSFSYVTHHLSVPILNLILSDQLIELPLNELVNFNIKGAY